MSAVDGLVRSVIAPVLEVHGFQRRGKSFFLEVPSRDRVLLQVRPFRLGSQAAEFWVNIDVQPAIWGDWIRREGGGDTWVGMWRRQIPTPIPAASPVPNLWAIDPSDTDATRILSDQIAASAAEAVAFLDVQNLIRHVWTLPENSAELDSSRTVVLATLLASMGPSEARDDAVAAYRALVSNDAGGELAERYVTFLESWTPTLG